MSKINLGENVKKIPSNKIGIDMGQTLSKLAYLEGEELSLTTIPTQTKDSKIEMNLKSKEAHFTDFSFTGGKSFNLFNKYSEKYKATLIDEFEANVVGVKFLYNLEKKKELSQSLIVSIGTGTSIVLIDDNFEHLGGSALGGGFFMGLIKVLFKMNDFREAIEQGKKGNRYNVDLKVSDIYSPEDKRVDLLFREFTAATLGKINQDFNISLLNKEDIINSTICMIGENIGTIATTIAELNKVKDIVFCGGFLIENRILKNILSLLCKVNNKKPIFLKNSEFCAAIGALLI
jgi:type II pantothenate kinase